MIEKYLNKNEIVGCICGNAIYSDKGEHNFVNAIVELTPREEERLKKSIKETNDRKRELFRKDIVEIHKEIQERNEELKELCKNLDFSKLPKP